MKLDEIKQFYKDNPVAGIFVIANCCANAAFAHMMSSWDSGLGILFGISAVGVSIGLAIALPIIGMAAGTTTGKNSAIVIITWLVFTSFDVGFSYVATTGRFEYAKLNAEKTQAITEANIDISKMSKTLDKCWGLVDCNSQQRMDSTERALNKLEDTKVMWTPHQMAHADKIVPFLVIGFAIIASLGSSIMGFIFGLNNTNRDQAIKKTKGLSAVA